MKVNLNTYQNNFNIKKYNDDNYYHKQINKNEIVNENNLSII